jgi:hypothetical protein
MTALDTAEVGFEEEFKNVDLGDARLNERAMLIANRLGATPTLSIPAASHGRAEMEAAYRFFDNDKVTPHAVLAPHREATIARIKQCDLVVLAQDTTEMDLTRPQSEVQGTGPLTTETRRGSFFHPLIAFDQHKLNLGTVWHKHWVREKIHVGRSEADKQKAKNSTPIEEKESIRWIEGVRAAREVAQECPNTQCVCVSDSESDIYELFSEPLETTHGKPLHLVIRGCRDRLVDHTERKVLAAVRSTPCLYTTKVDISSRKARSVAQRKSPRTAPREARTAQLEVRAITLNFIPGNRPDRKLPALTLNVVLVEETIPPDGEEPIQWILITTLPIDTREQVELVVQCYCTRWQIEIFFRTLKSGCNVEERLFERFSRFSNCLSVYVVVAWRVMYLCHLGRNCPDMDCEVVFTSSEWKSVYMVVTRKPVLSKPPQLNVIIRMIATLGGYVDRKSTQPGTQTLWLGLQRVNDLAQAWDAFGPENRKNEIKNGHTCVEQ